MSVECAHPRGSAFLSEAYEGAAFWRRRTITGLDTLDRTSSPLHGWTVLDRGGEKIVLERDSGSTLILKLWKDSFVATEEPDPHNPVWVEVKSLRSLGCLGDDDLASSIAWSSQPFSIAVADEEASAPKRVVAFFQERVSRDTYFTRAPQHWYQALLHPAEPPGQWDSRSMGKIASELLHLARAFMRHQIFADDLHLAIDTQRGHVRIYDPDQFFMGVPPPAERGDRAPAHAYIPIDMLPDAVTDRAARRQAIALLSMSLAATLAASGEAGAAGALRRLVCEHSVRELGCVFADGVPTALLPARLANSSAASVTRLLNRVTHRSQLPWRADDMSDSAGSDSRTRAAQGSRRRSRRLEERLELPLQGRTSASTQRARAGRCSACYYCKHESDTSMCVHESEIYTSDVASLFCWWRRATEEAVPVGNSTAIRDPIAEAVCADQDEPCAAAVPMQSDATTGERCTQSRLHQCCSARSYLVFDGSPASRSKSFNDLLRIWRLRLGLVEKKR